MEFLLPHYFTSSVQISTIDSSWSISFHTRWYIGITSGPQIGHSHYNFCLKITGNVKSCCECEAGGIELLLLCGIQDFRPSHLPCKWWCKYYSRKQVLAKNNKYQVYHKICNRMPIFSWDPLSKEKYSLAHKGQLGPPQEYPIWGERWRRKARHWEHPKMYPPELYYGFTIPPAKPCWP